MTNAPNAMTTRLLLLSLVLMLSGCASTLTTGKHVPITKTRTPEQAVTLATRVLAALPEDQIRSRVKQRFPQISDKHLRRIQVSYTTMHFYDNGLEHPPRKEVHLFVTIQHDKTLHPIADEINDFVADMLRHELARQKQSL